MNRNLIKFTIAASTLNAAAMVASANEFDLSWFTLDNGGGYCDGGGFSVEGTIGQMDAGYMAGGMFELDGGFWALSTSCACPGDVNGDGVRNGEDVQAFVSCMLADTPCDCANIDGIPGLDDGDVAEFVSQLLVGEGCS